MNSIVSMQGTCKESLQHPLMRSECCLNYGWEHCNLCSGVFAPSLRRAGKVGSFTLIDFAFTWKKFYTPLGIIRRWQHIAIQGGCRNIILIQVKGTCKLWCTRAISREMVVEDVNRCLSWSAAPSWTNYWNNSHCLFFSGAIICLLGEVS